MPTLLDPGTYLDDLVGPTRDSMGSSRPGVHVSSIISSIEEQLHMRSSDPFPGGYLFAIVGLAWELWVRSRLGEEDAGYIWQLTAETDGITGTLDALHLATGDELEVIECKATWQNASKTENISTIPWRYMCQVKAYCYMVGAHIARMYVLHVAFPPVMRVVRLEFSNRELEENWLMVTNQARAQEMMGVRA